MSSTLSILFVIETSGGGSGRHLLDLVSGLAKDGHRVHVLYSRVRAEPRFESALKSIAGVTIASCAMRRSPHPSDARAVWAIRRHARQHGPFDVIHGHSSKGGALARLAASRLRKVARVYTPHCFRTLDPELGLPGHVVFGSAEKALGVLTDAFICVSPEERTHALRWRLDERKLHVVSNGVDPPDMSRRAELRRELGIAGDETVIGFLGRYVPQKAPARMLELAAALTERTSIPPWRIVMVGEGPFEAELRAAVSARGLDRRFTWLPGARGATAMTAFDLFAMPSVYEGMPYVLLEAAAAGLPIVSTLVGGARAVIDPGVNGFLTKNWSCSEFAEAVTRLVTDGGLRVRMSEESRRIAASFTTETMIERTLAVYRAAIATRRRDPVTSRRPRRTLAMQSERQDARVSARFLRQSGSTPR